MVISVDIGGDRSMSSVAFLVCLFYLSKCHIC